MVSLVVVVVILERGRGRGCGRRKKEKGKAGERNEFKLSCARFLSLSSCFKLPPLQGRCPAPGAGERSCSGVVCLDEIWTRLKSPMTSAQAQDTSEDEDLPLARKKDPDGKRGGKGTRKEKGMEVMEKAALPASSSNAAAPSKEAQPEAVKRPKTQAGGGGGVRATKEQMTSTQACV